ncbi:hypothetical protein P280DRAFT_511914 [Massarina eburnea CBS 473.64]|uniref:Uncharacterized protein n=1 Tax=Massarina eburnea CBS 473.64 TaxID=1395130 RepID=A0A6A6RGS6_9PLEO|nr:hypothetical protein P280DRAFT_511914 [Massarina eburnea CBS 473.64]
MGFRKSLKKAASDFFPAANKQQQQSIETTGCIPSEQNKTPLHIEDCQLPESNRLAQPDLNLKKSVWRRSWLGKQSADAETSARVRKRLVKKAPASELPPGPDVSHLSTHQVAICRNQTLKKTIQSINGCAGNEAVAPSVSRYNTPVTPEPRPIPDSAPKGNLFRRHSAHGLRTSVAVPGRFMSMKYSKPPTFLNNKSFSTNSNSSSYSNAAVNSRSQSSGFESPGTSQSSTSNSTPTKIKFAAGSPVGEIPFERDSATPELSSRVLSRAALPESSNQTLTPGITPGGCTQSPNLLSDSSRTQSFTLNFRDSWCNPRLSRIFEKTSEPSLIPDRKRTLSKMISDGQLAKRSVSSDSVPYPPLPNVPNFSHRVLSPVTRSTEKIDLLIDQAIEETKEIDNTQTSTEERRTMSLTREEAARRTLFRRSIHDVPFDIDTRGLTQGSPPKQSNIYNKPSCHVSALELPEVKAQRRASYSPSESHMVDQWLEPSPPVPETAGGYDDSNVTDGTESPQYKSYQNLGDLSHIFTAHGNRESMPAPLTPYIPQSSEKSGSPFSFKEEFQDTLQESLDIPLPCSRASTPDDEVSAWPFPVSSKAKGKLPVHNEVSTASLSASAEQIREAVREGKKRYARDSKSYSRPIITTRTSSKENQTGIDELVEISQARSPAQMAFVKHKKSYSAPVLPTDTHAISTDAGVVKWPDTGFRFKEMFDAPSMNRKTSFRSKIQRTIQPSTSRAKQRGISMSIQNSTHPVPDLAAHPAFAQHSTNVSDNESPENQGADTRMHQVPHSESPTPRTKHLVSSEEQIDMVGRNSMTATQERLESDPGDSKRMIEQLAAECSMGSSRTSFHTASGSLIESEPKDSSTSTP